MVRLLQAAFRRSSGGVGVPIALHPSRRHLQRPSHRSRRQQRHVQGQGLSDRGTGSLHRTYCPLIAAAAQPATLSLARSIFVCRDWPDHCGPHTLPSCSGRRSSTISTSVIVARPGHSSSPIPPALTTNPHSTRGPINAPLSRVLSLKAFRRRPQYLPPRRGGPVSETLHTENEPATAGERCAQGAGTWGEVEVHWE